jgi:hypothetical protein
MKKILELIRQIFNFARNLIWWYYFIDEKLLVLTCLIDCDPEGITLKYYFVNAEQPLIINYDKIVK